MKISLFGSATRISVALSFVLIGISLSLPALAQSSDSGSAVAESQGDTVSDPALDWAGELEARDPLATKIQITFDDLERGLQHPEQRKWVIQRYFEMVPLSAEQQREFLESAFEHPDGAVRRQAAIELERLDLLSDVVRQTLIEWIRTGDPADAESAIVGLQFLPLKGDEVDQVLVDSLIDALNSSSLTVRVAAARQLENLGPAAVPILLETMQDPEQSHEEPADILSRIIRAAPTPTLALPDAPEVEPVPRTAPAEVQSKSMPATEDLPTLRRKLD